MELIEKIGFARKLLEEVKEEVLANIGSPPFPDLDKIQLVIDDLDNYLGENEVLLTGVQRMLRGDYG